MELSLMDQLAGNMDSLMGEKIYMVQFSFYFYVWCVYSLLGQKLKFIAALQAQSTRSTNLGFLL